MIQTSVFQVRTPPPPFTLNYLLENFFTNVDVGTLF